MHTYRTHIAHPYTHLVDVRNPFAVDAASLFLVDGVYAFTQVRKTCTRR